MKLKQYYLQRLLDMAIQNRRNHISIPVEPPPANKFERIRVFNGLAAFWLNESCYEIRNCPWGRPGSLLNREQSQLEISSIEVKTLKQSMNDFTCLHNTQDIKHWEANEFQSDRNMQFVILWDSLFGASDFSWSKNPLVWNIHFNKLTHSVSQNIPQEYEEEIYQPLRLVHAA